MVGVSGEERFGPYTVHECVGTGGMATVHRATILLEGTIEREVALKRLLPYFADQEQFLQDFVREAKLAASLRHPNIVRVYELGKIDDTYFIAMELVRGASLGSMIRKSTTDAKRPSLGAVVSLMLELTDALDHAYNGTDALGAPLQLVHRDLTPSNLLVTEDGHLKIIDFGVAKAMTGDFATASGYAKGKIGYMSPEAVGGQDVDARTDIFSAGVVMWELLTGRRLFQPANDWDTTVHDKPIEPPSRLNPECTPEVDRVVLRCLAAERGVRWPSADALNRELARISRPFAATTNAKAVLRWKRTLRVASTFEPYAAFALEEAQRPRAVSPNVISRVRRQAATVPERATSWPPEPTTNPQIRIEVDPDPEMALVPDTLIPSDFDAEATAESPSTRRLAAEAAPTEESPAVGRRSTRRKPKPPPVASQKGRAPPLRPPNPGAKSDRIPRRSPLDTEPNPVAPRPRGRGKPG